MPKKNKKWTIATLTIQRGYLSELDMRTGGLETTIQRPVLLDRWTWERGIIISPKLTGMELNPRDFSSKLTGMELNPREFNPNPTSILLDTIIVFRHTIFKEYSNELDGDTMKKFACL